VRRNCILKHVTDVKIEGKRLREDEEEDVSTYWMTFGEKRGYKMASNRTLQKSLLERLWTSRQAGHRMNATVYATRTKEVTGRRGRRRKYLLDDVRGKTRIQDGTKSHSAELALGKAVDQSSGRPPNECDCLRNTHKGTQCLFGTECSLGYYRNSPHCSVQSPKLLFSSFFDGREGDGEVAPGSHFKQSGDAEFRSTQYTIW